jgi:anti-sigma factor RsiW
MHLDDERLQRLQHGELDPHASRSMVEHVAACPECRARLAEAERDQAELYGLLRLVDHPPPSVNAETVAVRARLQERGWGRWAAGILLATAVAGAAYAMPGSPLRGWTKATWEWIQGRSRSEASPAAPVRPVAGLAVPAGYALTILFESAQPRSRVRISLGERAEVQVRAPAGAARFSSEAGRLRIANHDSIATFEIEIPRGAPRVEIQVAGRRIFLKDGPRIVAEGSADRREIYLLPLTPPPSR